MELSKYPLQQGFSVLLTTAAGYFSGAGPALTKPVSALAPEAVKHLNHQENVAKTGARRVPYCRERAHPSNCPLGKFKSYTQRQGISELPKNSKKKQPLNHPPKVRPGSRFCWLVKLCRCAVPTQNEDSRPSGAHRHCVHLGEGKDTGGGWQSISGTQRKKKRLR